MGGLRVVPGSLLLPLLSEGGGGGGVCTLAFERGAAEPDLALHGDWRSSAIRAYYPALAARSRVALALAQHTSVTPSNTCPQEH